MGNLVLLRSSSLKFRNTLNKLSEDLLVSLNDKVFGNMSHLYCEILKFDSRQPE
jgi:hypothetical protein